MHPADHMCADMKPLMLSLSIYYTMFARNKLAQKPLLQQKISVGDKIKRPLQTVLSRPYGQGCPYWPNQPLWRLAASGPSRGPFGQVAIKSGLQVSPEPLATGQLPWSKRQNHGEARCPDHRHGSAKNATGIGGGGIPRGWGWLAFPQARSSVGVL
jgi:hypothetical protein